MLEFHRDQNQKPPAYSNNVRFHLAKQKIQELFLKFLSQQTTGELVHQLIKDIKNKNLNISQIPHPLFTNQKLTLQSSLSNSLILNQSLKSPQKQQGTPPKQSPKASQFRENISLNLKNISIDSKLNDQQGSASTKAQDQSSYSNNINKQQEPPTLKNESMHYQKIPQFYFPNKVINQEKQKENQQIIEEVFQKKQIDVNDFHQLVIKVLQLPQFLSKLIFAKIDIENTGFINKQQFLKFWNKYENEDPKKICFNILKQDKNNFIQFDDFKPMMQILLDCHPGLEFLQATPEFQDRYGDTVIHRIFFMVNRQDNGQITWREFKNSQLFESLQEVDREEDINKVRNFFSYEHFYVIYCKFWELDQDHDFLITKDEFARYQGHGLSKKVVDRIFEGIPRKLKGLDGKMTYEDFIYFILAEEDKTTLTSIEYWFKLIDLDENGIITGYEMEYFYEEQRQRLEYLNHEIVFFQDVVCQMVDLLKPEDDIKFYLSHFKEEQHQCGVFFNILTNLNKFVSYEQRDPFGIRNELLEHPDFSDWDRFAQQEYLRLAMEEENNENAEIDVMDPWDGEVNQQQENQQQDSPK